MTAESEVSDLKETLISRYVSNMIFTESEKSERCRRTLFRVSNGRIFKQKPICNAECPVRAVMQTSSLCNAIFEVFHSVISEDAGLFGLGTVLLGELLTSLRRKIISFKTETPSADDTLSYTKRPAASD